jgi:hypothetical protein
LTRVAVDGCTFDPLNTQVGPLLYQHIWSKPPVDIDPEAAPPDVPCNMLSRPPDFYAWARPTSEGASSWMLCPAYCASLNQWLEEQESVLAECAMDAGI